jgi:site-specific DNA-adenine methylase
MVIITGLKKSLILQQVSLHMILQTNGERLQQNMALLKTLGPNHGREYYLYKETLLENAKEGDFIYLDPPYSPESPTANFTSYTYNGFSNKDQEKLDEVYKQLDEMKCKVMLINSNTPLVRELYAPFATNTMEVDSKRAINCKGAKREGHSDLIICNYKL